MDRFYVDDSGKKLIYQEALEFMGEARGGMSWERFSMQAVRYSNAFIDMLNVTEEARQFLSLKGVTLEYVHRHIKDIFARLHFNRENDHYLALCLPHGASEAQINRRWKDLMLIYHPDRSKDEEAAGYAKRINEAYNVLKHPEKRREYDMKMTMSAVAHFGHHRKKDLRPRVAKRYPFISPGMRRILPRLIIPCCIVISSIILFIIFLNNRPVSSLPQSAALGEAGNPAGEKAYVMPITKESKPDVGEKETAFSAEFQKFYREIPAAQADPEHTHNIIKKNGVGNIDGRVVQTSAVSKLHEGNGRRRLRETEITGTVQAAPAEAPATNRISEKEATGRQPLGILSPGQESSNPGREPNFNDTALNEKYGDLETEVFLFLVRYIQAYEEGNISKFMDFFSHTAVDNGGTRYEGIRQSYKKTFENGRYSYTLKNVSIKTEGNAVVATADYSIKRIAGGNKGQALNGKMRWTLGRENGTLKIVRMDYDRR